MYFLTVFDDKGNTRCIGFNNDLKILKGEASLGHKDLFESCDNIVIEKYNQGMYMSGKVVAYYKWDYINECYEELPISSLDKQIVNYAIG